MCERKHLHFENESKILASSRVRQQLIKLESI